jgi:hypothetical protein
VELGIDLVFLLGSSQSCHEFLSEDLGIFPNTLALKTASFSTLHEAYVEVVREQIATPLKWSNIESERQEFKSGLLAR